MPSKFQRDERKDGAQRNGNREQDYGEKSEQINSRGFIM